MRLFFVVVVIILSALLSTETVSAKPVVGWKLHHLPNHHRYIDPSQNADKHKLKLPPRCLGIVASPNEGSPEPPILR